MTTILRFVQFFTLGTWVGGILYLSFAVAPGAFGTLPSPDLAGALVGLALGRLHLMGIVAGVAFLLASIALGRSLGALGRPAPLLVILMLGMTLASQYGVTPRMDRLRAQMGSVAAAPADSPARVQFNRLHRVSVRLETGVLVAGLIALFLISRKPSS